MLFGSATAEHFRVLQLQPWQTIHASIVKDEAYIASLLAAGAWSCLARDGRVLGIGGFLDQGGGRGQGWALLAANMRQSFVRLHRAALQAIESAPYRRLEVVTREDFCEAHKWVELLGFEPEAPLRSFFPDGSAGRLWCRIKG